MRSMNGNYMYSGELENDEADELLKQLKPSKLVKQSKLLEMLKMPEEPAELKRSLELRRGSRF